MKKGVVILFSLCLFLGTSYGFWGKKGLDKKEETKPKIEVQNSIGTETSTILGTETSPVFQTPVKEVEPLPSCEKKKEAEETIYPKGKLDKQERTCSGKKSASRSKSVPDNDPPKPIYPKK